MNGERVPRAIVVAVSRNGVIGLTDEKSGEGGRLPWRIKSDLRHFKETTGGHAVVMGRRTFESLAGEGSPEGLTGRTNIVVSKSATPGDLPRGVVLARSLEEALDAADRVERESANAAPMVCILGGGEIFEQSLAREFADRVVITDVDAEISLADHPGATALTSFPGHPYWSHDPAERFALGWRLLSERQTPADPAKGDEHACWFRVYERFRGTPAAAE